MEKTIYEIGQTVKCINAEKLKGNDIGPPLELDVVYPVKGITLDKEGNQHLDVGLVSKYSFVSSYETSEQLPEGDKIHWCHPSRFELVK
jgi:hypothetical protein